jgi:hypothetical protein
MAPIFLAPEFPFGFRFQRLELSQKEQDGIHPSLFFPTPGNLQRKKNANQFVGPLF